MALQVEHELHGRRRGLNRGLGLILIGLVALVFVLTIVKILSLGDIAELESFDHVARPQIIPEQEGQP